MRDRIYKTEALILRRRDFGEADRILIIATPGGKRHVVAKGVRKTKSRIAGHIELFMHTTLLLAIGRNLDIVTQSQVLNQFRTLHNDLTRLGCAYYIAELYDACTRDQEENRPLFGLLVQTFAALDTTRNLDLLLRAYELRLLGLLGYRPQLHRCVLCGELLTEEANRFSPAAGGVVCPRDAQHEAHALPMDLRTFKLLRYLQRQPFANIEQLIISAAIQAETKLLLQHSIKRILERDIKSAAFLESVRQPDHTPAPTDI
jgi:DNA repair protein RecO (recombination protein O)